MQEEKVRAKEVVNKDQQNIFGAFRTKGLIVKKCYGITIEDPDGKKFIDFTAGGTTAVGYSHPRLTRALTDYVSLGIDHIDRQTGITEIESDLALEIKKSVSGKLAHGKVLFGHSGSDIIEKAIRLVRFAENRPIIVSYFEAHHGANSAALSASPTLREMGTNIISRFFQLPGFVYMPFPDRYRPWSGIDHDVGDQSIDFLEHLISNVISPKLIAGVIVEPILSLGGNIVPPDGYFKSLEMLCARNGIPLIADEVLTGIGKTGRMFAMEHWDVHPDVMCIGKALSGPLPLTLMVANEQLADKWETRDYAGISKDGYILGCAASLETLRIIHDENLVENSRRVGHYLEKRLVDMQKDLHLEGDVRGLGLMLAIDLVSDEKTKKPDSSLAEEVVSCARNRGLIVGITGAHGNIIRFLPSLTVTEKDADRAVEILSDSFSVTRNN